MSEMPWSLWRVDENCLTPKGAYDLHLVTEKYKAGTLLRARFAQPRSLPHHNLYWAVLEHIVQATQMWNSSEDLHEAIKLHLHMVRGIAMLGGGMVRYITKSTDFTSMDQGEFRLFFKNAMLAIEESTGINTDDVIAEVKKKWGLSLERESA